MIEFKEQDNTVLEIESGPEVCPECGTKTFDYVIGGCGTYWCSECQHTEVRSPNTKLHIKASE